MDFEVYCDESRPDVLCSKQATPRYLVIGSLWMPAASRDIFKRDIHQLRDRHKVGGEFKWSKVSPSRIDFYKELIAWYMAMGDRLRFRCIAVDREQLDLKLYHDDDQELGFYKFYYQMLHQWILDCNRYNIYCDFKRNREADRLHVLRRCLDHANLSSEVVRIQAIRSRESVLLQLTDVLTGAASARLNNTLNPCTAKFELVCDLESRIGRPIQATARSERKLNVFKINLRGGW